ncbi:MAG: disulfide bond formation protein B [Gammaproteobacteria bacterium]|nr:disulfide bond formation protein B [Gammaproteobacteria bacterium]
MKASVIGLWQKLAQLQGSIYYWLTVALLALSFESLALFYQYQLHYGPCVLCIQTRVWVLALLMVGLLGIGLCRWRWGGTLLHLLTLGVGIGLLERSWQLLGTERGWIFGSCSMDPGFPLWFALDRWLPQLFAPTEACGYTPELLFGVTMAEGLLLFSVVLLLWSLLFVVGNLLQRR